MLQGWKWSHYEGWQNQALPHCQSNNSSIKPKSENDYKESNGKRETLTERIQSKENAMQNQN